MRCHYEVLGVSLDVDIPTLRAAYKKCALKWHPDKNLDNAEKAKEEFQLVQQAFEVLSDPHERAWYDTHREAILKGGIGKDYKDDSLNLFPYFSTSCYQGYGDDEKGFYAVYREVFNQIFAEDVDFDPEERPKDDVAPTFGKSDSSYEEVVHPFYAYWENYCTTKTFVWLDEFDIREAPNRRVMRLMEKENKKIREKAKKQRNEEIRQLVRFVRKRDKRLEIQRKYFEEKAAENAVKAKLNRLRQLEERKREIAETTEADWAKMANFERELQEIENNLASEFGDHSSEEETETENHTEIIMNHLYCIACNKMFKNEKSFANHESSKKHKENVAALKVPIEGDIDIYDDPVEGDISDVDDNQPNSDSEGSQPDSLQEESLPDLQGTKKKKSKKVLKPVEECVVLGQTNEIDSPEENYDNSNSFNKTKKQDKKRTRKKNLKSSTNGIDADGVEPLTSDLNVDDTERTSAVTGKAEKAQDKKQKRKKHADLKNKIPNGETKDLSHTCAVCNSTFESKNKLFNHLKTTGHSVYLPKAEPTTEERPTKSRNRNSKCSSLVD